MGVLITTPTIMIRTISMQSIFMFIIFILSLSKKDLLYINFINVKKKIKRYFMKSGRKAPGFCLAKLCKML